MKLVIETARNGYVIRDQNDGSEPEDLTTVADDDPADATLALLGEILDRVGYVGSRYDERRVRIAIEPGDKWEPPASFVCPHEHVEGWSYNNEPHWTCRCGAAFQPVTSEESPA
jgi:hypothetical protein